MPVPRSMEDLEVFHRQAVIVKNGKIFVEDEPFFCDDDDGGGGGGGDVKPPPDADTHRHDDVDEEDGDEDSDEDQENEHQDDDDDDDNRADENNDNINNSRVEGADALHATGTVVERCGEEDMDRPLPPHPPRPDRDLKGGPSTEEREDEEERDESDKENRICYSVKVERRPRLEEEEEEAEDVLGLEFGHGAYRQRGRGEAYVDYLEEELLLRLVERQGMYDDVDGLRLHGLPDAQYLHCGHSGQEVQRISVITALPSLLKDSNAECMRRVVPKVREVLYVAQQDMQLAASTAFLQILQDKLVPLQSYTQTFLQTILTSVDSKDAEVSAAWLGTLLDVIELLPSDVVKKDILGIAINKGQLQQPVSVRLSCCKILGKIATKFESSLIKKDILPVVQQLCQDVEHEVRACMCHQLHFVAQGLGTENTKSAILPELLELANDEESNVRIAGLDTVVNILPMMDNDSLVTVITPLVCKFCQKAMQTEDATLPVVAKQFGRLSLGLQSVMNEEQKCWFIDFYRKLCKVGLPDKKDKQPPAINQLTDEEECQVQTRSNAVYNFPAFVQFVTNKNFKAELGYTLTIVCKDPSPSVRKTIAGGFHEVCKLLGHQVVTVFPDLIHLLRDENIQVLEGIVANLPTCMEVVIKAGPSVSESKASSTMEVVQAFLAAEAVVFSCNSWRLQEDMMRNMSSLGAVCPQDLLYNKVIPILLFKMKHGRALPVRHAAARSLLVLMRHLYRQEQRDQLIETLKEDFCHGRSCHSRGLFIVVCKYAIELYSKAFFKEHFFECVLALTSDIVPNIRLRSCTLLPSLKRMIKLPYDNALKGSLEQCVRKVLVNERDRDVMSAMKQAVDELDQIHVQMESMVSRRKNFEDDADDQVKEEEEKMLLQLEEKERKDEEARRDKKNSFVKKDPSKLPALKKGSTGSVGSISNKLPSATNSRSDVRKASTSLGPNSFPGQPASGEAKGSSVTTGKSIVSLSNGHAGQGKGLSSSLPQMIKSKSTTSIPSLAHIPHSEGRPSTPPRKEPMATRIPVYHSLPRTVSTSNNVSTNASSSGINKGKVSPAAHPRSGSNSLFPAAVLPSSQRKGSAGSLPSLSDARRGSLGSACSSRSEPTTRTTKKSALLPSNTPSSSNSQGLNKGTRKGKP